MKKLHLILSQMNLEILTPTQSSKIKGGNPGNGNGNGHENGNGQGGGHGNNGCPPPWQ